MNNKKLALFFVCCAAAGLSLSCNESIEYKAFDCSDGEKMCQDNAVYDCNDGEWAKTEDCATEGKVCNSTTYSCEISTATCTEGTSSCQNNKVVKCQGGTWVTVADCGTTMTCDSTTYSCKPNTTPSTCTPGCTGNTLTKCEGDVPTTSTCDYGCLADGSRCAECNDGDTECADGENLKTCSNGKWSLTECGQGEICDEDETTGKDNCIDEPVVISTCAPHADAGTLKNGESICVGNILVSCTIAADAETAPTAIEVNCEDTDDNICDPTQKKCIENLETPCADSGLKHGESKCDDETHNVLTCDDGTTNTTTCDADKPCANVDSKFECHEPSSTDCTYNESIITDGNGICDGTTYKSCSNTVVSDTECTGDTPVCDATVEGGCRAPKGCSLDETSYENGQLFCLEENTNINVCDDGEIKTSEECVSPEICKQEEGEVPACFDPTVRYTTIKQIRDAFIALNDPTKTLAEPLEVEVTGIVTGLQATSATNNTPNKKGVAIQDAEAGIFLYDSTGNLDIEVLKVGAEVTVKATGSTVYNGLLELTGITATATGNTSASITPISDKDIAAYLENEALNPYVNMLVTLTGVTVSELTDKDATLVKGSAPESINVTNQFDKQVISKLSKDFVYNITGITYYNKKSYIGPRGAEDIVATGCVAANMKFTAATGDTPASCACDTGYHLVETACVENCKESDNNCEDTSSGSTLTTCNTTTGLLETSTSTNSCAGKVAGVCFNGATKCDTSGQSTCASGAWGTATPCTNGCNGDVCAVVTDTCSSNDDCIDTTTHKHGSCAGSPKSCDYTTFTCDTGYHVDGSNCTVNCTTADNACSDTSTGSNLTTCNTTTGLLETSTSTNSCAGKVAGVCFNGATKCDTSGQSTCASGAWGTATPCDHGCNGDVCAVVTDTCSSNDDCIDTTTHKHGSCAGSPKSCDYTTFTCDTGYHVDGSNCTVNCTTADNACSDTSTGSNLTTCNTTTGVLETSTSPNSCAGTAAGVCFNGATKCDTSGQSTCASGAWGTATPCTYGCNGDVCATAPASCSGNNWVNSSTYTVAHEGLGCNSETDYFLCNNGTPDTDACPSATPICDPSGTTTANICVECINDSHCTALTSTTDHTVGYCKADKECDYRCEAGYARNGSNCVKVAAAFKDINNNDAYAQINEKSLGTGAITHPQFICSTNKTAALSTWTAVTTTENASCTTCGSNNKEYTADLSSLPAGTWYCTFVFEADGNKRIAGKEVEAFDWTTIEYSDTYTFGSSDQVWEYTSTTVAPVDIAVWNFDDSDAEVDSGALTGLTFAIRKSGSSPSISYVKGNPETGKAVNATPWSTAATLNYSTDGQYYIAGLDFSNYETIKLQFDGYATQIGKIDVAYQIGTADPVSIHTYTIDATKTWKTSDEIALPAAAQVNDVTLIFLPYNMGGTGPGVRLDNITITGVPTST